MKKRLLGMLLVLAAVLGGCGAAGWGTDPALGADADKAAGSHENVRKQANAELDAPSAQGGEYIPPEMKGDITISTMYDMEFLSVAAQSFMKKYPDVNIMINTYEGPGGVNASNDYRTWLNTKIMSGNAEDIIFTTWIPVKKYMDMGVFMDLSGYLNATPEINDENYFMNVIESARDDKGRLFIMPCAISQMVLSFDRKLTEGAGEAGEGGVIRFSEAVAYAKPLVGKSSIQNTFLSQDDGRTFMNSLVEEYYTTMIDTDTGEVAINTDQYINMLKDAEELLRQNYLQGDNDIDYYNMEYCFAMNTDMDMQSAFYNLASSGTDCMGMPVADAKGNVYTGSQFCFGITDASQNKALAWEFMKYVLSDEIQCSPSVPGFAVNRLGFEASSRKHLKLYTDGTGEEVALKDYMSLVEQWIGKINKCNIMDPVIMDYFIMENIKFFEGKQSAEQTAQILQNQAVQYLNE